MMKLKSYNSYEIKAISSDREYVSVIFESDSGYKVTFSKTEGIDEWTFESEPVTFEEFEQAKKMFETILKSVKELEELK